jgi:hypothetical protein
MSFWTVTMSAPSVVGGERLDAGLLGVGVEDVVDGGRRDAARLNVALAADLGDEGTGPLATQG